ncbi:hypothetical protein POSPLADRAFT_1159921 [Postia placenta MAD-698-R-SB12]|uniref:NAD-dependent epimerase/dehydratase domain-containing protein n=1 Tax=Postia placenta MAD-698-R-SB12 TaxID=670580 RepID=A0A1X6MJH2_9APHY|nr:hypothetical protein POSPLADRAFT_1159921 [Postia placenta MAD-698-R-SB12]OSX56520.1 hypothetical protein POSPLADRAFT_1159921 [Postia placenta MAD-698-R-SB12]
MPSIPPQSLIVVTGITGYIASHVGLAALQAGHRVRGTVRDLKRAEELRNAYAKQGVDTTKLEFIIVDDITSGTQLANAIKGVDGVAHVALPGDILDTSDDMPHHAVKAAVALLQAAANEPSIKRIVFTSSSIASYQPPALFPEPVTDKNWNDGALQAWENATAEDKAKPEWAWIRYAATKILSEKAAWKWMEENKPPFDIVTILPNANFGPVLYGGARSTGFWIQSFLKGHNEFAESVGPQWFIDVRDDGRLHVAALTNPSLSGKRIWGVAEPTGWNQILAILRKNFPDANVAPDLVGEPGEPTKQKIENTVATEALGGWIGLEQSLVDTGKSLGF